MDGDEQDRTAGGGPLSLLDTGWRAAFDEAWQSWRGGNFGIGAALVDPTNGDVVSVGRNRVAQVEPEPGLLSGNMTAHAEMNAFAALRRFDAEGLHLYTTLQPCLMCAASAMQLKVSHVHLAAEDEFFDDLDELWSHHALTAERAPRTAGPFTGRTEPLARFARLLPLTFTLAHFEGRAAADLARARHPNLVVLAEQIVAGDAAALRRLDTVDEALDALWDRLLVD